MAPHASLSLERKLPLLISVLLSALTVGLTWAGYVEVRRASELRGIERVQRLASEIADMAQTTTERRSEVLRRVASDPAVIAHLTDPTAESGAAAAAILPTLSISPADTPVVAELRSITDARQMGTRPELPGDAEPIRRLIAQLAEGGTATGDLYARDDSVFYWVGAQITRGDRALGYVVQRRVIVSNARAEQQIRGLVGSDSVSIYFASDSGSIWSNLGGRPMPPPTLLPRAEDPANVIRYTRGSDRVHVAAVSRIPNTPLRVVASVPYEALLDRPSTFLRRNVAVGFVMLVIGIAAAWLLSRHITRPLRHLTEVADAMAMTGDYSHRAHVNRRDETGRLADAFNTMASQVQQSHQELARQNEESRSLAERLDEANRAKADFLATMSHELRTPLNAIGGYVDLIDLGVRGPVTDDQRRDLARVRYNQHHLLALIGNILDFARLDARKLPYEIGDVRVDQAVSEIITAMEPLLDEKGLTRECIGCGTPVVARADRARVEQILLNLLSNAIRFTPTGGHIALTVRDRASVVEIAVTDTGVGIPPDKIASIFEPFVQLDRGLTRQVGGTGLGLTISRELARAMRGDLTAESDGTGGARFCLTLPSAHSVATTEEAPEMEPAASRIGVRVD